ncbi:MAG TPA: hypothetical protein ACFYEG_04965 [Candidatus Wujingus californicus]|uniref:hypothetical protein n=1 Tax=Candidatus Wujingus californicus TaxID=3367618 RepID=UPI0040267F61
MQYSRGGGCAEIQRLHLAVTKNSDYLQNPDKQAKVHDLEKQIDQMVYKLYGLAPEEIAIVESR